MFHFNNTEKNHELWSVGIFSIMEKNRKYAPCMQFPAHSGFNCSHVHNMGKYEERCTPSDISHQHGGRS